MKISEQILSWGQIWQLTLAAELPARMSCELFLLLGERFKVTGGTFRAIRLLSPVCASENSPL